jgi:hypothetical protein
LLLRNDTVQRIDETKGAEETNGRVLEWKKAVLAVKQTSTLSIIWNLSNCFRNQGALSRIDDLEEGAFATKT